MDLAVLAKELATTLIAAQKAKVAAAASLILSVVRQNEHAAMVHAAQKEILAWTGCAGLIQTCSQSQNLFLGNFEHFDLLYN